MGEHLEQVELRVANLDCEAEAAAIQRDLERAPGVETIKVSPTSAKVSCTFDPDITSPEGIQERLSGLGFPVQEAGAVAGPPPPWRNPKVITSVVSGVLLLVGWLTGLAGAPGMVSIALHVTAIVIGGYFFGREAIEGLVFRRTVGIELLMSLAAVVATIMGAAGEGATLVFLYSISEAAEGYTAEKTRSAVRALMDLAPRRVTVLANGRETEIPVEQISPDDVFLARPGQSVATDGLILTGTSAINEAPVTGESMPVEKRHGDQVLAGTINGEGALEIRATKAFADNTLSRIIRMVEDAHERKGKSQRFIERFGRRYSPVVLVAGILVAVLPPLLAGAPWGEWITRATVLIVAAAPCALVISIPITLVASLGTGARRGVLVKGGIHMETLARIKVVAFDKTGTLTEGVPEVTDVVSVPNQEAGQVFSEDDLLATAAGVERWSEHPLARAIVRAAKSRGVEPRETSGFQSRTGFGASAQLDGDELFVGSVEFFETELGVSVQAVAELADGFRTEGRTVVLVGDRAHVWGVLAFRDNPRANAAATVDHLKKLGIRRVIMLTGDNERTAWAIAREVHIDEVYGGLKPEDKATKVEELRGQYGHVLMVGDGVNDAPALAAASVGVAMGAAGTDVALETADVALMADDLSKLAYAVSLARRSAVIVRQNLVLSMVVIGAMAVVALLGMFSLPVVVLGHELSEFAVIANGLRMLRA